jgi:nucleoid-associated protein YgaU
MSRLLVPYRNAIDCLLVWGTAVSRRTKFILVAIVIVVGFGLAWQFRKRGPSSDDAERTTPFAVPGRLAPADLSFNSASPPVPAGQTETSAPLVNRPTSAANAPTSQSTAAWQQAAQTLAASLDNSGPQPKPAIADEGSVPRLSTTFSASVRDANSPAPIGGDGSSIDGSPRLESSTDSSLGPMHKVADGDTLTELAHHYLGSPDRWRELYEYNRDVLANPELLPIGAELRIPTAPFSIAQEASPAGPPQPVARTVSQPINPATAQPKSDASLAPVVSATAADNAAPAPTSAAAAKLQRLPPVVGPVARALRVAPRTYVVQPGDTLNSIAERLYGDGRHEDVLLQANRNLLPNGQDLRPGMVLVVPLAAQ